MKIQYGHNTLTLVLYYTCESTLHELMKLTDIYRTELKLTAYTNSIEKLLLIQKKTNPDIIAFEVETQDSLLEITQNLSLFLNQGQHEFVFISSKIDFAYEAIRVHALDYLLKPIENGHIEEMLRRFYQNKSKTIHGSYKYNLHSELNKKIVISTSDELHILKIQDIIRCQSDNYYTNFILNNDKNIIVSKTLKEFERLLLPLGFVRPHNSHIVNIEYVKSFTPNEGGQLILTDGTEIPVSRRRKEKLLEFFKSL